MQIQSLLAQNKTGISVHADAAGKREAATVFVPGEISRPFQILEPILIHSVKCGLVVRHETDDRQGKRLSDKVVQCERPAGQGARFYGDGANHTAGGYNCGPDPGQ